MDDQVSAAAERILHTHVEEDCVYCGDESCDAVTVAQAALDAQGREARLEAIVKEAWRFWAALNESAVERMEDRGYLLLRFRKDRYQAFDALFRTSAALSAAQPATEAASDG